MSGMPLGFRFDPSDDELIGGYLIPRLVGGVLPWDGIVETDLYGEAPWNVLSEQEWSHLWQNSKINSKKWIYVFSRLKKASAKKISRRAGCGTWDGQTGSIKVKDLAGKVIGSRKAFRFEMPKEHEMPSTFGNWTMHEYAAEGAYKDDDLVLCKVTKTTTCAGIKRGIHSNNGGDEKRQKLVEGNNNNQLFDWNLDELIKLIDGDDQQNLQHQDYQQLS